MGSTRGSDSNNDERAKRGGARNNPNNAREDQPAGARSHQPRMGGPKNTHRA